LSMHGELGRTAGLPFAFQYPKPTQRESAMSYRVYVGPPGTEKISPLEKDQLLFKEFASLDDAFGWARHVNGSGRVTLAIDGDDGTSLNRREIAAALQHSESLGGSEVH
ncbi:MAG: hypothetical protein V7604_1360, partial [Hyphomicrobiales bacterium]